jgi:hypothetical protein
MTGDRRRRIGGIRPIDCKPEIPYQIIWAKSGYRLFQAFSLMVLFRMPFPRGATPGWDMSGFQPVDDTWFSFRTVAGIGCFE